MHAHIVLAHPEPQSFNHHLTNVAEVALKQKGWSVSVSDLYGKGFDPCERFSHFATPENPGRFNVQSEQRHACETGSIPADVIEEIGFLDKADLLILQYPMWWHLPPAILKGWFDRVFIYGEVYKSKMRFENGRFKNKSAMLSVTVGTSQDTYAYNGRSGDIDLMLWPINFNLAYVGYTVLNPFIAYGVEAGIQYSNSENIKKNLQLIPNQLADYLCNIEDAETISFNNMAEWGDDGRIKADARAHSAFIRHKSQIDLG